MKILATLLVRNEAELVADCLEHHLRQGVDAFLVTDHLSVDGLSDVLHEYREVIVDLQYESDGRYRQDQWVTRMARRAVDFHPDWILHLDADERWYGLDVLRHIPSTAAWVRTGVWRNHLPLAESMAGQFNPRTMPYFELPGRTGSHAARFAGFGSGSGGKILHRPLPDAQVGIGNHWLHYPPAPQIDCDGITVHHYPIRSLEQLRRKVLNGAAALDANAWMPEIGSHWRKWRDLDQQGRLREVFQTFMLTESEIRSRLADGTLHLMDV